MPDKSTKPPPAAIVKHRHQAGCGGQLYRLSQIVHIDRKGRIGNGGWVAHDYVCNCRWAGCEARVLLTERAVRRMAVAAIGDRD